MEIGVGDARHVIFVTEFLLSGLRFGDLRLGACDFIPEPSMRVFPTCYCTVLAVCVSRPQPENPWKLASFYDNLRGIG